MILVIALGFAVAFALFAPKKMEPLDLKTKVYDAIRQGIVDPLRLPQRAADILYRHAVVETGNFKSKAFAMTNSLFNRHKGSGRGDWTNMVFYLNSGDPDLRIFVDVYQSARDMRQLLEDKLYARALSALRAGNGTQYFLELETAGFSARVGDYAAVAMAWQRENA